LTPELPARQRLAFVAAAAEWSREHVRRPFTADELAGIARRLQG
jgi:hypothetical protein